MADAKKKAKKRRIDELEDELPHDERFRSDSRLSIRKVIVQEASPGYNAIF